MRTALCLVLVAACGISNKVAPDGAGTDGVVVPGDGSGGSAGGVLAIELTDKPASLGNQASVSFGWNVNAGATVECRIDSEAYAACTSPHAAGPLADGAHTFDARATLGEQHAEVPEYTFTVDTVAPALVLTGQPPQLSPVATATFHFMVDDATAVTCQLDAAAPAACTDSASYQSLADGQHTFTLSGTDGAGNTATKTYTWTVDTSAPTLTITTEPPNPTNTTSARFEFTIGTSATVSCQLDSGAAVACTSPQMYSGLAEGNHTFTLRGTNTTGQTTTQAYTWQVDTTPPAVSITSQPVANSPDAAGQFAFTVNGASTVTCALDGGTAATCSATYPYSLPDGSHTFAVKAVDLAGNATTKSVTWTIDTVAPTITLGSMPPNPSTSAAAQFAFTVNGASSTTCKLDSGSATACTTSASYGGLGDGNHTFTITATDAATNVSTKTYTWLVDTVAPALSITSAPSGQVSSASAHITFTAGADAVSVTCQLDGGAAAACSGAVDYTGLSEGSHTFTVRASDAAGNTASRTATWTVDTTAPSVMITSYPPDPTNSRTAPFQFTVTGATATTCQLDGGAATACSTAITYDTLADGVHTFTVKASDGAGNVTTQSRSWTVDATPPTVTFGTVPGNPTKTTADAFSWSVSESATVTCQVDTGSQVPCPSGSYTTPTLGEGPHTFTVRATDAAMNTGSAVYSWKIDTTAPSVGVYIGPASNTRNPSITYYVSEPASVVYWLDRAPGGTASSNPFSLSGLADGTHYLTLFATDAAGNQGYSSEYSWVVDATAPSIIAGANCNATSLTWSWTATDASGIANCSCSVGGATFNCAADDSVTYNDWNETTFSITCKDAYGNSKNVVKTIHPTTTLCQ